MKLKDKYIYNLKRLKNAEEYFEKLTYKELENIEKSKPYEALRSLLDETIYIYDKLKKQGVDMPVNLEEL